MALARKLAAVPLASSITRPRWPMAIAGNGARVCRPKRTCLIAAALSG